MMREYVLDLGDDDTYTVSLIEDSYSVTVTDDYGDHVYLDKSILRKFITDLEQIAKDFGV
jgi:hypothetical protein